MPIRREVSRLGSEPGVRQIEQNAPILEQTYVPRGDLDNMSAKQIAPIMNYVDAMLNHTFKTIELRGAAEKAEVSAYLKNSQFQQQRSIKHAEEILKTTQAIEESQIKLWYMENVKNVQQSLREQFPDGKGLLQAFTTQIQPITSQLLTAPISDPEAKGRIYGDIKQYVFNESAKVYQEEENRIHATNEVQTNKLINLATASINNGTNVRDALKSIDSLSQTIPEYYPWKQKMFSEARNQIIFYSIQKLSLDNPGQASLVLKNDPIYKELEPNQVIHIQKTIKQAAESNAFKATAAGYAQAIDYLSSAGADLISLGQGIANGQVDLKEWSVREQKTPPHLRPYIEHLFKDKMESALKSRYDTLQAVREAATETGNFASQSAEMQNSIFTMLFAQNKFSYRADDGTPIQPAPEDQARRLRAMSFGVSAFNKELPGVLKQITQAMRVNDTKMKVAAIDAFKRIYSNSRSVLPDENNKDMKAMLAACAAYASSNKTIDAANNSFFARYDYVEQETQQRRLEQFNPSKELKEKHPIYYEMNFDKLKALGIDVSKKDLAALNLANQIAKEEWIMTGDEAMTDQKVKIVLQSQFGSFAKLNGTSDSTNKIGTPEAYIANSSGIVPSEFQDSVRNLIKQKLDAAQSKSKEFKILNAGRGIEIIDKINTSFHECKLYESSKIKSGYLFLVQEPGFKQTYRLKVNYTSEVPLDNFGMYYIRHFSGDFKDGIDVIDPNTGRAIIFDLNEEIIQNYNQKMKRKSKDISSYTEDAHD